MPWSNQSGGGGPWKGGGNNGGKKSMSRTSFDALSPPDQAAFAREGGVVND